jgi:hypothetical protein
MPSAVYLGKPNVRIQSGSSNLVMILDLRGPILDFGGPILDLRTPISDLRTPISDLRTPILFFIEFIGVLITVTTQVAYFIANHKSNKNYPCENLVFFVFSWYFFNHKVCLCSSFLT